MNSVKTLPLTLCLDSNLGAFMPLADASRVMLQIAFYIFVFFSLTYIERIQTEEHIALQVVFIVDCLHTQNQAKLYLETPTDRVFLNKISETS